MLLRETKISYLYILFIVMILFIQVNISSSLLAKTNNIDEILITGNNTTRDIIILNQLNFSIKDSINPNNFDKSKNNLLNTNLFENVTVSSHYDKDTDKNYVIISVEEKWYIYPIPYYTFVNDKIKKLSLGVHLTHNNFFGLNHKLTLSGQWLNETKYRINYDFRRILHSNFYLSSFIEYQDTFRKEFIGLYLDEDINKNFKIETYSAGMNLSYKINSSNIITFRQTFNNDIVEEEDKKHQDYKYPTTTLEYIQNTLNFSDFPSLGHSFKFSITSFVPVYGKYDNFTKYLYNEISLKKPISLYPFNLKNRKFKYLKNNSYRETEKSRIVLSFDFNFKQIFGNRIPDYKKLILGFDTSIRGISKKYNGEVIHKFGTYLQFFLWKSSEVNLFGERYEKTTVTNYRSSKKATNKHNTFEIYAELFQENVNVSKSLKMNNNISDFSNLLSTAGLSIYFKGPIITDFLRLDLAFDLNKSATLEKPIFGIAIVKRIF